MSGDDRARIDAKKIVAAVGWTTSALIAGTRTLSGESPELTVWSVLAAAVAACATAGVMLDYVAHRTARWIVEKITEERETTAKAIVRQMGAVNERAAERYMSRLVAKQDKTIERVARELADALREDEQVTRIR